VKGIVRDSGVWITVALHMKKNPHFQRVILELVEAAGIEPASASTTLQDLHV